MSIACKVRPIGGEALLPDGYRRCEYLESTGTQWIDTGIKLSSESEVKCDWETTEDYSEFGTSDTRVVYGAEESITVRFTLYSIQAKKMRFDCPTILWAEKPVKGTRYKTEHSQINGVYVNGVKLGNFPSADFICTKNAYLFTREWSSKFIGRIYSFSISRNNQLQLNFIPCLDDKGKPCMFDIVSRTPYYNEGTGEFLYKLKTPMTRKLPRGYQPLDYLESNGTQWIDTGVYASADINVKTTWEWLGQYRSDAQYVYGGNHNTFAALCATTNSPTPHFYAYGNYIAFENAFSGIQSFEHTWYSATHNGLTKTFAEHEEMTSWPKMWLFSGYGGMNNSIIRIYNFSIAKSGVLQLDFQPCLDPTGKPCMWDYVTRRPFYNQNTTGTDFLYG